MLQLTAKEHKGHKVFSLGLLRFGGAGGGERSSVEDGQIESYQVGRTRREERGRGAGREKAKWAHLTLPPKRDLRVASTFISPNAYHAA